jgi:phosphoribosylformylglycinamidine synthase PurS subunit
MSYKAQVHVSLKKSVLDPQGKTVLHALDTLGFKEARDIRVGKFFEVALDSADQAQAEESLKKICEQVLINPVIEDYSYKLESC